jgi:hypothetical protein
MSQELNQEPQPKLDASPSVETGGAGSTPPPPLVEPVAVLPAGEEPSGGGGGGAAGGKQTASEPGTVNTTTGDLSAGDSAYIGSTDNRQFIDKSVVSNFFGSHETSFWKSFAPHFMIPISAEAECRISESHVSDGVLFEGLCATLNEKRLLVLTGEPETGKTTTSLCLSSRLRQNNDGFGGAYLVRALDRNVKIDFSEITGRPAEYGSRMLLFQDAFARGNRDVVEFFAQMGKPALGSVTEQLQRSRQYLVFTADSETIKGCQRQLADLGVECRLPPFGEELLLAGLEQQLARLAAEHHLSDEEIEARLPAATRPEAVRLLRTMPHIARFVERDFLKLGAELDWRDAVRRISSLEDWFLSSNLADDFDAWCFVLTLALCQCTPYAPGVPWLEFEHFRELISAHLRRKLHANWDELAKPSFKELISENLLLERCRAVIDKDPATGADLVRFANDRYPDMLWEVLLKSNRKVLSLLLPVLKKTAESPADPAQRARAAAILGRLGEIDPHQVTYTLMSQWIASRNPMQQAAVGHLYQGIWASKNANYRSECLRLLGELVAVDTQPEDASEMRPMVWTAIAAYRQIGVYDLPLAMGKYREIIERYFAEVIENTSRVDRILGRIEKRLQERQSDLNDIETMKLSLYHDILRDIAQRVFQQDSKILLAVQYAIVGLCLTDDPVKVFDELLKWVRADRKSLGALVALILLEHDGIAAELERRTIETEELSTDDRGKVYHCNLLVRAVASSDEAVYRTALFLGEVYDSFFKFYPPRSRTYFNKSFAIHLKNLVENAMPVERVRAAVVHLFDELLMSESPELKKLVHDLANEDPDFKYKDSKYFLFKKELHRRRLRLSSVARLSD